MPSKGSLPDRQRIMKEKNLKKKTEKISSHDILEPLLEKISRNKLYAR